MLLLDGVRTNGWSGAVGWRVPAPAFYAPLLRLLATLANVSRSEERVFPSGNLWSPHRTNVTIYADLMLLLRKMARPCDGAVISDLGTVPYAGSTGGILVNPNDRDRLTRMLIVFGGHDTVINLDNGPVKQPSDIHSSPSFQDGSTWH